MKFSSSAIAAASAMAIFSTSVAAATVMNTTQINSGFAVSSIDLLQTSLASTTSTGDYTKGYGVRPISALTNGIFGGAFADYGSAVFADGANSLTYTLNRAYNLTSIATFSGWDGSRGGQSYTISYASAASPMLFVALASVYNNASGGGNVSTRAVITSGAGLLASNVVAVKFDFRSDLATGFAAYREIDVFGAAAVPEPASWALMIAGFGMVGAAARRRRMVVVA